MVKYVSNFYIIVPLGITVMFDQLMYRVDEDDGPAQFTLILSDPSSTDTIVEVFNTNGSATGEY